eukprot:403372302
MLNAKIGQYKSINQKIDWSVQDPVLFDLAMSRISEIEGKVMKKYEDEKKSETANKVAKLTNQALQLDQKRNQQEILKGNYYLNINDTLDLKLKIQKFAAEPVAFFLHKKGDFLQRLMSNRKFIEEQDRVEYENILRNLAMGRQQRRKYVKNRNTKDISSLHQKMLSGQKEQIITLRKDDFNNSDKSSNETITSQNESEDDDQDQLSELQNNTFDFNQSQQQNLSGDLNQTNQFAKQTAKLDKESYQKLLKDAISKVDQELNEDILERRQSYQRRRKNSISKVMKMSQMPKIHLNQTFHGEKSFSKFQDKKANFNSTQKNQFKPNIQPLLEQNQQFHSQTSNVMTTRKEMQSTSKLGDLNLGVQLKNLRFDSQDFRMDKSQSQLQNQYQSNLIFNQIKDRSRNHSNKTFFFTQQAVLYNLERETTSQGQRKKQILLNNTEQNIQKMIDVHHTPDKSQTSSRLPLSQFLRKITLQPIKDNSKFSNLALKQQKLLKQLPSHDIEKPQLRSDTQRKLDKLQRNCLDLSHKMHKNLNELQVERDKVEQLNESFDHLVDDLKGLEGIEAKVIATIYQYKKLDKYETQEESKNITKEYKSGVRDPARIVARMEKSTIGKRNKKIYKPNLNKGILL